MTQALNIVLHGGAHKTASTHLQQHLQRRLRAIEAAGLKFYGPQYFRQVQMGIWSTLGLDGPNRDDVLAKRTGTKGRIILSEENYMGLLIASSGLLQHQTLYPNAADRVIQCAKDLAPHKLHLTYAIRNPADLIVSAYSQALLKGHYVEWAQFTKDIVWNDLRWSDVLWPIAEAAHCASITVWRYEDYHDVFDQIIQHVLGPDHPPIIPNFNERTHQGLSHAAVDTCAAWHAEGHRGPLGALAREDFPVSDEHPKYQPFPAWAAAELMQLYDADVQNLRDHPNITFLQKT